MFTRGEKIKNITENLAGIFFASFFVLPVLPLLLFIYMNKH
jgi:hypothetical protein